MFKNKCTHENKSEIMKKEFTLAILLVTISLFYGCKKTDSATVPVLTTSPVTTITFTTAISGGIATSDGKSAITSKGVCWSTSSNPTTSDPKTNDGSSTGQFISNITGLTAGTPYFVRAYAINSVGTAYGDEISFSTNPLQPAVLSTNVVTSITVGTAVSGGNISTDNGAAVTARGVCWGTTTGPTIAESHTSDGIGIGSFVSNLAGLLDGTQYFVRAYATNSSGTAYGDEVSFTTIAIPPANEIIIQSMAFIPQTLTITVNSTVKWKNLDGITHTVTSDNASWDSGNIAAGKTFKFTFTATGTFNYHCTIHPSMTGTIIVQ
jgi:plastocyanin